ncbi:plasmid mobilization relaxosome protein MobC [Muribaculaceae bacterium Isolate-080 (Janvier)]|nr:plasmid mobilization relaxosome protein MobC [Muribaculaceae bacterium Isolate-080 (Janvier)]
MESVPDGHNVESQNPKTMTFTRRKKSPPGASEKSGKSYVVSVRLNEEQYKTVQEYCRKSGRKLSDFWRHALLNAKVTAIATPDDMAILRQIGSMANNLNQLAKKANEAGFKLVEWSLKGLSKEIKTLYTRLSYDWRHN